MRKDRPWLDNSKKHFFTRNTRNWRLLIVAICLVTVGTAVGLLIVRNSQAAAKTEQEGRVSKDGLWQDVDEKSIASQVESEIRPKAYRTLRLNMDSLKGRLVQAPMEFTEAARNNPIEITLPMPEGEFGRFKIMESPMLEPDLASQFPEIKTYRGRGLDDPTATMRCDITLNGFHAFVLSSKGSVSISPYSRNDTTNYISYYLRDDPREAESHCFVEELSTIKGSDTTPVKSESVAPLQKAANGTRNTYRLAVAATAEFTAQNGGTVSSAVAAITTRVNGVNAIYNVEVGIQLMLINNTSIIYTDPSNEPYTTQNISKLITENQTNLDSVVGAANYDIGQVFDATNATGGAAGLALIASTCAGGQKGSGTSGGISVLLAAHELGHQLGATHTFNDNTNGACGMFNGSNQRTAASAYEPGSGSTIMSYGGTCGAADLQQDRDSYFHVRSLEQINAYITGAGGATCGVATATGNGGVTFSKFTPVVTIPDKTPFRLTLQADDADGDPTTVTWEEYDLGAASPPEGDNGDRPLFRSYIPTATQSRTFPRMDYILSSDTNNPPATYNCSSANPNPNCGTNKSSVTYLTGEALPVTTRTMMFKGTARDGVDAFGSVTVQVNVRGGTGPFGITSPETSTTLWTEGTRQTVVWAAGDTASPPINCASVKISLSLDSGLTFPIVLAESVPNSGSAEIFVPEGFFGVGGFDYLPTDKARIKIESLLDSNFNSFFDISKHDFHIRQLFVTNTNDSGPGSLRQAITDANSDPGLTRIPFSIDGAGVHTINLLSELPLITFPVIIDGLSQGGAGYSGPPLIELNGAGAGPAAGLTISAGGSTVTGLVINRFSGSGIVLENKGGNRVRSCYIGTDSSGTAVLGNGANGVFIDNTPNNDISPADVIFTRSILSGNNVGILISGSSSSGNKVRNNFIGTNADGARLSNTFDGIHIDNAPNNQIGTLDTSGIINTGNIISGNGVSSSGANGIEITGATAAGNTIQANFIGLNTAGTAALSNLGEGIRIENAPNTIIGGSAAFGNTISGNQNQGGIALFGSGSSGTVIQGNYLGTSADGTAAISNNATDIYVESANNRIGGGTTADARNVISGSGIGIYLFDSGATGNVIQGNYIGTDKTGAVPLKPNGGVGIQMLRANNNTVGGTTPVARNIISGNGTGIFVNGSSGVLIQGNYIGTNAAGDSAVGNFEGIDFEDVTDSTIGGTPAGAGNVISGSNGGHGINIFSFGVPASNLFVRGNLIGTNAAGTGALGNSRNGISAAVSGVVTIGGSAPGAGNVIAASGENGIQWCWGSGSSIVQGNLIGTDVKGTGDLRNARSGIDIGSGNNHVIGGTSAGAGNIIAFNGAAGTNTNYAGVKISGSTGTTSIPIRGNSIFSNTGLGIDLGGFVPNDHCDADTGANNRQNFPVITSAGGSGGNTTIQGTLDSTANTSFALDFYANSTCNASGYGEGQIYLGSATVSTDSSCNANINVTLPVGAAAGQVITAAATDPAGNTSEFSACVAVQASIATPAGNNVTVQSGGATVTYSQVTAPGNTTITAIDPNSAGQLPTGYTLCNGCPAFDITTTATYVPPIQVCLNVPSSIDQQTFDDLKLLHGENGVLQDRTSGHNTDPQTGIRTVCGSVNSLSPFLIAKGAGPTVAKVSLSGRVATGDGMPLDGVTITLGGSRSAETVTDSQGNYSFENLETGGLYIATPSFANYTFSPAQRSFPLIGSKTDAAFIAIPDTLPTANPLDTSEFFVRQQYLDFLGREPDQGGFDYWSAQINQCDGDVDCIRPRRIDVSAAFFASPEFQQTGSFVYRFYSGGLGRQITYAEFNADRSQVIGGETLEQGKAAFADAFVRRAEFMGKYSSATTAGAFVAALIRTMQQSGGVNLSGSRDVLIAKYLTGEDMGQSRSLTLRQAIEEAAFKQAIYNQSFVLMQYFGYLRRDAEQAGYDFWLNVLNNKESSNYRGMVCSFITSSEYQKRFSVVVTHSNDECR